MHDKLNLVKTIETEEAIVGKRKDGIIHVYYRPYTEINVELQYKMLDIFNEITQKQKSFFIFEADEFCSVTKEARDNAIKMEDQTPIQATVIMVRNLAQKLIADFYYKINRPKQPYKVVWQFEKGVTWLNELKEEPAAN